MAPSMLGSQNTKRLDGKVIAITGGNCGIGYETTKDLSRRGARVLMLVRSLDRGQKAIDEIMKENESSIVELFQLDLASLNSVRQCADKILAQEEKLDMLINNAGVMTCPYWKTEDGFEMQFGTNHVGHFLLTHLLLPLLKKTAETGSRPRIVIVSSMAHASGEMHWNDLNWEKSYSKIGAYCQSKLANVLHGKALARRLQGSGISVYTLHPGVINTELSRHLEEAWYLRMIKPLVALFLLTPFQGAQTTLYCCLEDSIEESSGLYYADCKEKTPHRRALDEKDQEKLWTISEELVGLSKNDPSPASESKN